MTDLSLSPVPRSNTRSAGFRGLASRGARCALSAALAATLLGALGCAGGVAPKEMNIPSKKQKNPGLTLATPPQDTGARAMEIPSKKQKNPGLAAPERADECADDSDCADGLVCLVNADGVAVCDSDDETAAHLAR